MRQRSRTLWATAVTLAVLLGASATARADDFLQHFRDQYQGKTFLLRGFYTGDKLRYDATGALIGSAIPGDWTTDGVIQLSEIDITHDHLTIKARWLLVSTSKGTFHFLVEDPKKQKKRSAAQNLGGLGFSEPVSRTGQGPHVQDLAYTGGRLGGSSPRLLETLSSLQVRRQGSALSVLPRPPVDPWNGTVGRNVFPISSDKCV